MQSRLLLDVLLAGKDQPLFVGTQTWVLAAAAAKAAALDLPASSAPPAASHQHQQQPPPDLSFSLPLLLLLFICSVQIYCTSVFAGTGAYLELIREHCGSDAWSVRQICRSMRPV